MYRGGRRALETRPMLAQLCLEFRDIERAAGAGGKELKRLLISYGEFEAGLADALVDQVAMPCHETRTARRASVALGRACYAAWRGREWRYPLEQFGRALADLVALALPRRLHVAVPEGFAYYGLDPEGYANAADAFNNARRPARAVVIGIRSIGTGLSGLVAGALEENGCRTRPYTVRPAGHPWNRTLTVADTLEREWRSEAGAEFAIVDEGPGISGSSFASVAEALLRAGVAEERISFFPSWDAPASALNNEAARRRWDALERYPGTFDPPWLNGMRDLSAGRWRELSYAGDESLYPAVQPQHEARKALSREGVLLKFSGLGRFGEAKLQQQKQLCEAGISTGAMGISEGYLAYAFVPGRPLAAADLSADLLERMAGYLAIRASEFGTDGGPEFGQLLEMIQVNTWEALRRDLDIGGFERLRSMAQDRKAVAIDGRMMPHEWLLSEGRILKTDAVDHAAGHFHPGPADIAWDLAGACVEFGIRPEDAHSLVTRYEARSGDRVPAELVRFYRTAYLAFRTGYCSMAADATCGTGERARFLALEARYKGLLENELVSDARKRRRKVVA